MKIKIKIEKKKKIPPPEEEIQEVKHELVPSMVDVKGKRKTRISNSSSLKVVRLTETEEIKGKKKSKKIGLSLILITVSLLIFGLLIWFKVIVRKDRIIGMMPEETVFYSWVDTTEKWPTDLRNVFTEEIEELVQSCHLNFKEDILPILGNQLSLALLPGIDDQFLSVLILELNEKKEFENVLSQQIEAGSFRREIYREQEIICANKENLGKCFTFLSVSGGNFFILSRDSQSLQKIIDTQKGILTSLEKSPSFKSALVKLPQGTPGFVYLGLEDLPKTISGLVENYYISTLLNFLDTQETENFALAVSQDDQGLSFEGALDISSEKNPTPSLMNFIPQHAVGAVSGYNLSRTYSDLKDELGSLLSLEKILKSDWGLDLEKDLISWMNKDYEIIFMAEREGSWNMAVVFELDDINLVKEKLELIEKAITFYYAKTYPREKEIILEDETEAIELLPDIESYQFSDVDFKNVNIKTIPNIDDAFSYTLLDNKLVVADCLASVKSVISAAKFGEERLIDQEDFKILYSKIPQQNNGILYIDMEKLSDSLGLKELKLFSLFKNFIGAQVQGEDMKLKGYLLVK